MTLVVDPDHLGTPEDAWRRSPRLAGVADWWPDLRPGRIVVVAPHPDDEVLGAAGLLRRATAVDARLELLAVTDGTAAPRAAGLDPRVDLATVRAEESTRALRRLGVRRPLQRLGLPDGDVTRHEEDLVGFLVTRLRRGDLCVAPWAGDGHPDHDACGRAADRAARIVGARSVGYVVWAWHWADPEGDDLPWDRCRRLALDRRSAARKRRAIRQFTSQTRPVVHGEPDSAVLPPTVLERFRRPFEVYVLGQGMR